MKNNLPSTNLDYNELDGVLMDLIKRFNEADSERKKGDLNKKIENRK